MKRYTVMFAAMALALCAASAHAGKDDNIDISRLTSSLDQLASDPVMGGYAQAEQARARDAINRLAQAKSRDRPHDLYLAERRVDLANAAAQLQVALAKSTQLDREHDQILLDNSRQEADTARRQLEHQRMQYQLSQEESARLQQQGEEASQAADQARAEADQAKNLPPPRARWPVRPGARQRWRRKRPKPCARRCRAMIPATHPRRSSTKNHPRIHPIASSNQVWHGGMNLTVPI